LHEDSKTDMAALRALLGIDMLIARITRQKFACGIADDATTTADSSLRVASCDLTGLARILLDRRRARLEDAQGIQNMLLQASQGQSGSAHVVVLGNEKGGSGKSTAALHIAVALLKAGQRVATIDLDCRQQSFTRYINNRSAWARRTGLNLELPVHCCIRLGETMQIADNENSEFQQFVEAVSAVERTFDFIVIDTPGTDSYLMRLAHSMADTLVTPINDSFLDFDVLGQVDPATYAVTGPSHYAEMVRDTRRKRRQLDGATTDWIVVRNRLSMLGSRNKQLVADGLKELSFQLGFRAIDGFAERVVYREFFPRGLTALDDIDEATLGTRPSLGHVTAREEVTSLLRQLKLPLDERGRRRAANRAEWFTQVDKPLEVHDIIA
jgi:chromosome partitioning protein